MGFLDQFLELVVLAGGNSPAVEGWVSKKVDALHTIRKESARTREEIVQELEEMGIIHRERMKRVQQWEQLKTETHLKFINTVKELESEVTKKFPGLAPPLRILIHQQTANLLYEAWARLENAKPGEDNPFYIKLIDFMETIQQDLDAADPGLYPRPQKTITYIREGAKSGQ